MQRTCDFNSDMPAGINQSDPAASDGRHTTDGLGLIVP
jgi:hypothetical protein